MRLPDCAEKNMLAVIWSKQLHKPNNGSYQSAFTGMGERLGTHFLLTAETSAVTLRQGVGHMLRILHLAELKRSLCKSKPSPALLRSNANR
jgi:hypothetical protein